jgi:hypothetical protein
MSTLDDAPFDTSIRHASVRSPDRTTLAASRSTPPSPAGAILVLVR